VETPFKQGLGALIFGITMFIGGWAALALPETNNKRVPETIAEANVFMTPGYVVDIISELTGLLRQDKPQSHVMYNWADESPSFQLEFK